jgi:hypothetical protein
MVVPEAEGAPSAGWSAPPAAAEPQVEPTISPPAPAASRPAALPNIGEVRQLFSQLQVRREPSGKVVIEAPSEAASTLSALFEGMAALLQAAAQPSD